jgi:hypothetical protein
MSLQIDLANPDDVRAKIPDVEKLVTQKRAALLEANREVNRWQNFLETLRALVSDQEPSRVTSVYVSAAGTGKTARTLDLIMRVLGEADHPMETKAIVERVTALADEPPKPDTITWTLWKAHKDNLIRKIGKGVYAPLSVSGDQLLVSPNGNGEAEEPER